MFIKHLELVTDDLPAQRDYYANVLELPVHLSADALEVQAGKTDLVFVRAPSDWHGQYHFCFNIPENQFVDAKAWLSARIPLIKDQEGKDEFRSNTWNSTSLYFRDAAGNILEFIARRAQPNAVIAPFNSDQILQVSEIGLPSKDVIPFAKELCEKLGVSVYKQDYSDTFTPIGDEEGLLILPVENRIWYPNTGVPAQMLPVKVKIEVQGREFNLQGVPYQVS
jgi:catechol 2,3-dioxygenase-like lactoylglutathione lyase family enzyme